MSDTYMDNEINEIENGTEEQNSAEGQIVDEQAGGENHHYTHHSHRSGCYHRHRSSSHHHSHSKHRGKSYRHRDVSSSELERIGHSVIYEKTKRDKIRMFTKRAIFCTIAVVFVLLVFASILNPDFFAQFTKLDTKNKNQELNELKIKIIQYEHRIEELEEIIEKYENGELPE